MSISTALGPVLAPDLVEQQPATDAPCVCTMAAADSTMTPDQIRVEVKSLHAAADAIRLELSSVQEEH